MRTFSAAALAGLVGSALVAADMTPTRRGHSVHPRADFCGLWDKAPAQGDYQVSNNLWGHDSGSGNQCTGVDGYNKGGITWHTSWSWSGGDNAVKSFANVNVNVGQAQKLSSIKAIPSHWSWRYNTQSITADVAYDLFTSSSATGSQEFEMMVWLAQFGAAKPISYSYDAQGNAVPIATGVALAGHTWSVYKGSNGQQTVFSFVVTAGPVTAFQGDLYTFFTYLIQHQNFDANQFLVTAQAGTEPFQGSNAKMSNTFKMRIHYA